jgi:hypothetical protein
MKYDLEQEVPELFLDLAGSPFIERVHNLITFFNKEGLERASGLFAVPWAPVGTAEFGHKLNKGGKIFFHENSLKHVIYFLTYTNGFLFASFFLERGMLSMVSYILYSSLTPKGDSLCFAGLSTR